MPPYRFRLATVQRVRESRRDDARLRLADANLAADKLAEEEQRIREEIAEARGYLAKLTASRTPDANRLIEARRYESMLTGQLRELGKKQDLVDQEIDRRREALAFADREVRALELLDERGRERHQQETIAAEQKQLDEAAAVAWRRRNPSS